MASADPVAHTHAREATQSLGSWSARRPAVSVPPTPAAMFEKGQRKFTIAVEGNIASGKSTLLEQLREGDYAQIVEEPVTKWQNLMPGPDGNLIVGAFLVSDCA